MSEIVIPGEPIIQLTENGLEGFEVLCRLCANRSDHLISIYSEEGVSNGLAEKMNLYLPVKVSKSDTLPLQCCYQCASTVLTWHELVVASVETDRRLRSIQEEVDKQLAAPGPSQAVEKSENERCAVRLLSDTGHPVLRGKMVDKRAFTTYMSNRKNSRNDSEMSIDTQRAMREGSIDTQRAVLEGSIDTQRAVLEISIDTKRATLETSIDTKRAELEGSIDKQRAMREGSIDTQRAMLETSIDTKRTTLETSIDTKRATLETSIDSKRAELETSIDTKPAIVEDSATSETSIDTQRATEETSIDIKRATAETSIDTKLAVVETSIDTKRAMVETSIDTQRATLETSIDTNRAIVETSIDNSLTKTSVLGKIPIKSAKKPKELITTQQFPLKHSDKKSINSKLTRNMDKNKKTNGKLLIAPEIPVEIVQDDPDPSVVVRKTFQCDLCARHFFQKVSLQRHTRIHRDERPYTCHVCGKGFRDQSGLTRHINHVHGRVKKFPCDLCACTFASGATRDDHRRRHTKERPYMCQTCGKSFSCSATLYIHAKIHTDVFPFECSACSKRFRRRQELVAHASMHSGARPYACAECDKCFRRKDYLALHRLVHTDEKPFECKVCGIRYRQARYLRNHVKAKHCKETME